MSAPRPAVHAVLLLLALGFCGQSAAADLVCRTLSESADGMRLELEVRIPDPVRTEIAGFTRFDFAGLQSEGSPGAPLLPVVVRLVAVPPAGTATLRIVDAEIEDLGTLRLAPRPIATTEPSLGPDGQPGLEMLREEIIDDPVLYRADGPRDEPARLGDRRAVRHQEVVPLEIRPLLYDPETGRARIVRSLRLEIQLRSGAGAAIEVDDVAPRFATGSAWQRIYSGLLVNPKSSESWRRAPRRAEQLGGPLKSGLLRPGLLAEEEWKIRVARSGAARILGSTLADAGFPDGTPLGQLRLYLKRYDPARPLEPTILEIPILTLDTDADGLFDRGDSFVFWGEHVRDDATSEDPWARYANENVYWLAVATSGAPARMPVRAARAGAAGGPTVFDQELVYEEDRIFHRWVFGSNNETVDSSALYFWTDRLPVARVTVPVPGRAPGASLAVCVETQEDHGVRPYSLYVRTGARDSVLLGTNFGTLPGSRSGAPPRQTTCGTALDTQIDRTDARIILQPLLQGGVVPCMDRVRLEYAAEYVATGDRIRCTSGGASGEVAFAMGGFTGAALRALDVTDPKSPATFDLTGALVSGTLTLTDSVPAGIERVYAIFPDAAIPTLPVELDRADDILGELASAPVGSYDVLVVAHDSFADDPAMIRWVAFRQAQGHRVRVVRTSDVYDAFRGGLAHYEAIHRLSRMAFTNWGIEYLMLVGDGSEDTVRLLGGSGQNFVPARVRYAQVASSSGGDAEYRNDMNDKYYAQVAGPVNDPYPDLLLGRLPVGSSAQLAAIVDKTILYETPQSGDDGSWRKRVVMYSDDEWVTRDLSGLRRHKRGCSEVDFQRSMARASDTVDGAFPGDLRAVRFFLRDFSDRLGLPSGEDPPRQSLHRPVPIDSTCWYAGQDFNTPEEGQAHAILPQETDWYQDDVKSALADSVGEGALIFAMQSHMNRQVVGDENIIFTQYQMSPPFNVPFRNTGKPFIVFGFGCHLNEYAVASEEGTIRPGDALGEELVLVPSIGAVASYASTGFEFLYPNNGFHEGMWRAIFEKDFPRAVGGSPVDSDTLASRWLLTELVTIGEIKYNEPGIISRHVLFGDPLLRLDAGVPRVTVDRVDNGFLQSDNRLVIRDTSLPLGLQITLRDEQGIDSLWVVKRLPGGVEIAIDSVTTIANVDTAAQILAKRSYTVSFQVQVDECNFDVVVGARDLGGRRTEFIGHIVFESVLLANGLPIQSGDRVDPRTAFRFQLLGCTPIPPPVPLEIQVDGVTLPPEQIVLRSDSVGVNWNADFVLDLAAGTHALRFLYEGAELALYQVEVGGFGMTEVIAFPNPMRKTHDVVRIYFHLGEPIAGGYLRVVDLNGRTVLKEDLAIPGVVRSDVQVPAGSIGTGVGQDDWHWNYVEILPEGRDHEGDAIANGVYLYELYIRGLSGQAQRKRDKLVIMR